MMVPAATPNLWAAVVLGLVLVASAELYGFTGVFVVVDS
jgi:general stress protein CsbA